MCDGNLRFGDDSGLSGDCFQCRESGTAGSRVIRIRVSSGFAPFPSPARRRIGVFFLTQRRREKRRDAENGGKSKEKMFYAVYVVLCVSARFSASLRQALRFRGSAVPRFSGSAVPPFRRSAGPPFRRSARCPLDSAPSRRWSCTPPISTPRDGRAPRTHFSRRSRERFAIARRFSAGA